MAWGMAGFDQPERSKFCYDCHEQYRNSLGECHIKTKIWRWAAPTYDKIYSTQCKINIVCGGHAVAKPLTDTGRKGASAKILLLQKKTVTDK